MLPRAKARPRGPVLRDVQHAISMEFRYSDWGTLKQALANRPVDAEGKHAHAESVTPSSTPVPIIACADRQLIGIALHAAMWLLDQHPANKLGIGG